MKTAIETITPDRAMKYLAGNHGNRPLRESWVDHLVQQIQSGNWQTTHQGIAIGKDGRLIDGQHRLTAIVRSEKSVQMNVTTGLSDDAYKVTDCGVKRTTADRIHLVDSRPSNQLMCQMINSYCFHALRVHMAIPVSMVEDQFLLYSDSWLWAAQQFQQRLPIYGRLGVMTAMAIYHVVNAAKASEFCDGYRTGENLAAGSPILALRRSIDAAAETGTKENDYWRAVAAMRAHLKGQMLHKINPALEDMLGNKNSVRLISERTARGIKAATSRKLKRA